MRRGQLAVELVPPADIDDLITTQELVDTKSLTELMLCQRPRGVDG
jgi:hypothetical protein